MHIFVASWFFPPATSSEAIVAYKLLRNSNHTYDVCYAESTLWSYKQELPLDAQNIKSYPVKTDSIDEWVNRAAAIFEERYESECYDAIMTRSMPPESIDVARLIRQKHPDIPWIASIADPIAKSPYDIEALINDNDELAEHEKRDFKIALRLGCEGWKGHRSESIRRMCALKDLEDYAINNATALIFPLATLKNYVLGTRKREALVVPHSFDRTLYPKADPVRASNDSGKITISFLGHSDYTRSLKPIVEALHRLQQSDDRILDGLHVRFIGNVTEDVRALIFNYYLYDVISVEPGVSYSESLAVMSESDWLIHVDAYFDDLKDTGGSIFFAGKIADYFGTDAPVLAISGKHSPAWDMISRGGGICVEPSDIAGIADAIRNISLGRARVSIDRAYRDSFNAIKVASEYDKSLEDIVKDNWVFNRKEWPTIACDCPDCDKLLSICIPAYNVERYLDRCLFSLMKTSHPEKLEIIVVNDGSPDHSRDIALAYQERYPSIVRLIDKENGGHGSTINAALDEAHGLYFRVIDGDDWVDGDNLSKMLCNIEDNGLYPDLVSTNYHQVYIEDGHMVPWVKVSAAENYKLIDFSTADLTMEYFTMASMMVKTDVLKKSGQRLQENTFYVDVEYILFPIPFVETVMFTPEYVYRYAVGNADQSINHDNFVKRYDHHDRVMRSVLSYYASKIGQMGEGQRRYMESLFVRNLLNSHYLLSLVWDDDRERGFSRALDFDAFLRECDKDIYDKVGKMYPAVREARSVHFDPSKMNPVGSLEDSHRFRVAKKAAKKVINAVRRA